MATVPISTISSAKDCQYGGIHKTIMATDTHMMIKAPTTVFKIEPQGEPLKPVPPLHFATDLLIDLGQLDTVLRAEQPKDPP